MPGLTAPLKTAAHISQCLKCCCMLVSQHVISDRQIIPCMCHSMTARSAVAIETASTASVARTTCLSSDTVPGAGMAGPRTPISGMAPQIFGKRREAQTHMHCNTKHLLLKGMAYEKQLKQ